MSGAGFVALTDVTAYVAPPELNARAVSRVPLAETEWHPVQPDWPMNTSAALPGVMRRTAPLLPRPVTSFVA